MFLVCGDVSFTHTKHMFDLNKIDNNHFWELYRGSYMSAHVLFNLLNQLGKRDKMRDLPSILSLFPN